MIKKTTVLASLSLILMLTGCAYIQERVKSEVGFTHKTSNFYLYPDFDRLDINRVIIADFRNLTEFDNVGLEVRDVFIQELKKLKKFEIVDRQEINDIVFAQKYQIGGAFSRDDLLEIGKKFQVDAIILGNVTHYAPYRPLILGIKLQMILTITGEMVWAVDEMYDTSLATTCNLAKQYYFRQIDPNNSLLKWELVINSMHYFKQFVCAQIIKTFNAQRKVYLFKR